MQSNSWGNTQQRWVTSGFPFTIFVMVAMGLTAFLPLINGAIYQSLNFVAPLSLARPWTMLTYPLLGEPSIWVLFNIGFVYFFAGSLERSWGTKPFALFWCVMSVVSALALSLAARVLNAPFVPVLTLLPVVSCAVVWGLVNSEERISFFFLPLRGIHISALACVWIVFNYAGMGWLLVPFALLGPLAAFLWLKFGITYRIQSWGDGLIPMSRPAPRMNNRAGNRPRLKLVPDQNKPLDDRFTLRDLNPLEWYAKRKRRKQFEKLVGGDD